MCGSYHTNDLVAPLRPELQDKELSPVRVSVDDPVSFEPPIRVDGKYNPRVVLTNQPSPICDILAHMRFRGRIELGGKTATGITVPEVVVSSLGSGRRPAVRITVGGHSYRTTVASMGGVFFVPLNAANRTAAGVAAGDDVDVDIELDTEPRIVTVPDDLAEALVEAGVRDAFDALSYTKRRERVTSISEAKTEATRSRRIRKIVAELTAG